MCSFPSQPELFIELPPSILSTRTFYTYNRKSSMKTNLIRFGSDEIKQGAYSIAYGKKSLEA